MSNGEKFCEFVTFLWNCQIDWPIAIPILWFLCSCWAFRVIYKTCKKAVIEENPGLFIPIMLGCIIFGPLVILFLVVTYGTGDSND